MRAFEDDEVSDGYIEEGPEECPVKLVQLGGKLKDGEIRIRLAYRLGRVDRLACNLYHLGDSKPILEADHREHHTVSSKFYCIPRHPQLGRACYTECHQRYLVEVKGEVSREAPFLPGAVSRRFASWIECRAYFAGAGIDFIHSYAPRLCSLRLLNERRIMEGHECALGRHDLTARPRTLA